MDSEEELPSSVITKAEELARKRSPPEHAQEPSSGGGGDAREPARDVVVREPSREQPRGEPRRKTPLWEPAKKLVSGEPRRRAVREWKAWEPLCERLPKSIGKTERDREIMAQCIREAQAMLAGQESPGDWDESGNAGSREPSHKWAYGPRQGSARGEDVGDREDPTGQGLK